MGRSANFDYIFQLIVHFPKPQCKCIIIIQITIYYGHYSTYDTQSNLWGGPFHHFNVFKNNIVHWQILDSTFSHIETLNWPLETLQNITFES